MQVCYWSPDLLTCKLELKVLGSMSCWRMEPQIQTICKSKERLLKKFLHVEAQLQKEEKSPTEFTDSVLKPKRGTLERCRWAILREGGWDTMIQIKYSCFVSRSGSSWHLGRKLGYLFFCKLVISLAKKLRRGLSYIILQFGPTYPFLESRTSGLVSWTANLQPVMESAIFRPIFSFQEP